MFYNADDIRWFKPVELWSPTAILHSTSCDSYYCPACCLIPGICIALDTGIPSIPHALFLRTKYGLVGHIREPRGTKGFLKASFDGSVCNYPLVIYKIYSFYYISLFST